MTDRLKTLIPTAVPATAANRNSRPPRRYRGKGPASLPCNNHPPPLSAAPADHGAAQPHSRLTTTQAPRWAPCHPIC